MSPVSWGDIFTLPLRGDKIMELRHNAASRLARFLRRGYNICLTSVRSWRNWQTHQLEGLAVAIPWWFESTRPHQYFLGKSLLRRVSEKSSQQKSRQVIARSKRRRRRQNRSCGNAVPENQ